MSNRHCRSDDSKFIRDVYSLISKFKNSVEISGTVINYKVLVGEFMLIVKLRKVDFFNKLDTDGSMSLSREEFRDGILMAGIPMTENEIESLLNGLDKDGDGEINYRFDQLAFSLKSCDLGMLRYW